MCATTCTLYSIASCRLVTLQYTSVLGNFEQHFTPRNEIADAEEQYQVGLGLFTWLLPAFYVDGDDDTLTRATVGDWTEGACVGYNTVQLNEFLQGDNTPIFESARILGIFSVLIAISTFLFGFFLSCLSIANWQRYMLAAASIGVAIVNGSVLMMLESNVCTDMGTSAEEIAQQQEIDNNVTDTGTWESSSTSHCELDIGGLVAIGAAILWVASAMIAYFFVEPVGGSHAAMVKSSPSKQDKAMKRMRKENKVDWNGKSSSKKSKAKSSSKRQSQQRSNSMKSNGSKRSASQARSTSERPRRNNSSSMIQKGGPRRGSTNTTPTMHSSFSMPKTSKYIVDDLRKTEVEYQPPNQKEVTKKSPYMANNTSLETRYIPNGQRPASPPTQRVTLLPVAGTSRALSPPTRVPAKAASPRMVDLDDDDDDDDFSEDGSSNASSKDVEMGGGNGGTIGSWFGGLTKKRMVARTQSEHAQKIAATQKQKSASPPRVEEVFDDHILPATSFAIDGKDAGVSHLSMGTAGRQKAVMDALEADLALQKRNAWACGDCV